MSNVKVRTFLRHVARAQGRRYQKQAALGRIKTHIRQAKSILLKPRLQQDVKRTILDDLKDRITSIIIEEKLILERQRQDEHTIRFLRARIEDLEAQQAKQEGMVNSFALSEHNRHEVFENALHDIEDKLADSQREAAAMQREGKELAKKEEALAGKLRHEEDVRIKKIQEITDALAGIEAVHARLSKRKNADPKQVSRLARMIKKHKKAIEKV